MTISIFDMSKIRIKNNFFERLFFFFYDIDERRRYTEKVHPLKALVGPSIVKRGRRGDFVGWVGVEGVCGRGS